MRFEDRYELQVPLGETDRGSVWSAKDRDQGRSVAVAVLSAQADEATRERFQQIHLAVRISRSKVLVRVIETGETADGSLFAAMELLERDSLRRRLENGPALPLVPTVRALCEVLDGLQRLHDQELAHGDVCPSNILVREDDERVAPRLIGLGMGREHIRAGEIPLDDDEQLLSLAYMSPAQARGEVVRDAASDVFSMAGVIYTVLTGHPPHHGMSVEALRADIASSPVWSPQRARTEVAGPLADVVTKALGPKSYESATTFRKDILEALDKATSLASLKTRVGPLSLEPGFPPEATTARPKMVPKPGGFPKPRQALDKKRPAFPKPKKPIPKPKAGLPTKAKAGKMPGTGKAPSTAANEAKTKKMPAIEPAPTPAKTDTSSVDSEGLAESVRPAAPPPWETVARPEKKPADKKPADRKPAEEVESARPSIPEIAAIAEPVAWDHAVERGTGRKVDVEAGTNVTTAQVETEVEAEVEAEVETEVAADESFDEIEVADPPAAPADAFVQSETPKALPIPDPLAGELASVPAPDVFSASPTPTGLEPGPPGAPFPRWVFAIPVLLLLLVGVFAFFALGDDEPEEGRVATLPSSPEAIGEPTETDVESARGGDESTGPHADAPLDGHTPDPDRTGVESAPTIDETDHGSGAHTDERASRVRVRLTGVPDGAAVYLDRARVSGTQLHVADDGADHLLEVELAGHRTFRHRFRTPIPSELTVQLEPGADEAGRSRPSTHRGRSRPRYVREPGF